MPAPRAFRPSDLYNLRIVGDPQISPDGTQVAYVVARHDEAADEVRSSIWVVAVDGSSPPRQFSTGEKDHSPRWAPDGRALLFVGDRGAEPQLQLASLDGGEPRQLTDAPHGVSQPSFSPDGGRVVYVARVGAAGPGKDASPTESGHLVHHDAQLAIRRRRVFDERRPHVWVVDVETGKATQLTKGDYGH